jgi:hypothetical protein
MNTKIYAGIAIEHGKQMADEKWIGINTLLTQSYEEHLRKAVVKNIRRRKSSRWSLVSRR